MLNKIGQHKYFLIFVLIFAYAHSIQSRASFNGELNWYIFTPEAAAVKLLTTILLIAIILFFLNKIKQSEIFKTKEALKVFITSLLTYLILMKVLGFLIALASGGIERNFNKKTVMLTTLSDLIDVFIYGSFFLAYYYFSKNRNHFEQLATYNQAISNNKITQLKAQLNPHFLFNNLNVLDQLIEEDKDTASNFLNEFAEIYRYVLQVSDKHLVPVSDELAFAEKYFNLIKHKYGNAYVLETNISKMEGNIVPLTLQLLLENAIQHNLGTVEKCIHIKISLSKNLTVSNNIIPKRHTKITSARALNNLKEQYALLSNQQVFIEKTYEEFSVTIPLLPVQ